MLRKDLAEPSTNVFRTANRCCVVFVRALVDDAEYLRPLGR